MNRCIKQHHRKNFIFPDYINGNRIWIIIKTRARHKNKTYFIPFIRKYSYITFTEKDAHCGAVIRGALIEVAVRQGLILVISNTKEFERVTGLLIEEYDS